MKRFSVAVFGSSLRSNFDKYSDKDLLIVAKSYSTLNQLRGYYELQGYSVSSYTYKKLEFLSDKGSLFVQHLKKESIILIDYKNELKNLLEKHKKTTPTYEQLVDSVDYFTFLKVVPDNKWGYAWYCDCFYVGLRNYLILKSAVKGEYKFSFLDLVKELLHSGRISDSDFNVLRQLRVAKKNYRERIDDEFPSREFVESLSVVGQKLKLIISTSFSDCQNFGSYVMNEIKNEKNNYYFRLRLIEIYYLMSGQRVSVVDKIICNPQLYAFKFKDSEFVNKLIKGIDKKNDSRYRFAERVGEALL